MSMTSVASHRCFHSFSAISASLGASGSFGFAGGLAGDWAEGFFPDVLVGFRFRFGSMFTGIFPTPPQET
jgi:hypothetical protein